MLASVIDKLDDVQHAIYSLGRYDRLPDRWRVPRPGDKKPEPASGMRTLAMRLLGRG